MRRLLSLLCLTVLATSAPTFAQDKAPEWKHGLKFRVRKASQPDFSKETPEVGCEFYLDTATKNGLYITDSGHIAVAPNPTLAGGDAKDPKWQHGLVLKARKAGEMDFTDKTAKFGIEVFRDENTGLLVYICETGALCAVKGTASAQGEPKKPTWLHGFDLKARRGSEDTFSDKTAKFGIEVFRDENNGNLVYITELGQIAVLPPPGTAPVKDPKNPTSLAGLAIRVRKAKEPEFTKDTQVFGAETFRDENATNLVYITEKGSLCVLAGTSPGGTSKAPAHKRGFSLMVRKASEADFTKDTKQYGGELFVDDNTGNLMFITETNSLAVTSNK